MNSQQECVVSKMKDDDDVLGLDLQARMRSSRLEQILQDLEHIHMRMCQNKNQDKYHLGGIFGPQTRRKR